MSEQESDQVVGRAVREYREAKDRLATLKTRCAQMASDMGFVANILDSRAAREYLRRGRSTTEHQSRHDKWQRVMEEGSGLSNVSWPSLEDIIDTYKQIQTLREVVEERRDDLQKQGVDCL